MPSPRQTQSHLRMLFAERGIKPRHRYGQNFLIDLNIHDLIVRAAELEPTDVVLEVGSGTGALTVLMAHAGAYVCAVEIDNVLATFTQEATKRFPNVRLLNADALAGKNRINPEVLELVADAITERGRDQFKLVANLPYSIASPLISNLLISEQIHVSLMVVTIQREVADRLCAEPATPSYGSLSVLTQALSDVEVVRLLPPTVFWPQPKVDSAIVRITSNTGKRTEVGDLYWFHLVVRRVFLHRRKYLRGVLHDLWPEELTKSQAEALLERVGLVSQVRAEALSAAEFISLANELKKWVGADRTADG